MELASRKMFRSLSIRDLENLSGVKAHTIRIWEKRYSIFNPERTATNIRTYSSSDLKKLLNISSVLKHGMKISKACSLSYSELINEIERIESKDIDSATEVYVNQLIVATVNCNNQEFNYHYSKAVNQFGLEHTIEKVAYPMFIRIGLMWSVDRLSPAQEHFATQLIRQKLFTAIDALEVDYSKEAYLLFLPEGENHEVGLLYANYLIKKAGHNCIYLGADVPIDGVKECLENAYVKRALTHFTVIRKPEVLSKYLQLLNEELNSTKVYISGVALNPISVENQQNLVVLEKIDELRKLL